MGDIERESEAIEDRQAIIDATNAEQLRFEQELAAFREKETAKEMARQDALDEDLQRIMAKRQTDQEQFDKIQDASTKASLQGFGNMASAVGMLAEFQMEKGGEAAKQLFAIQKAAGISEIGIQTAVAVMEAAPNPFLMAGVGALGAAQAAIVAATPPPEFPGGGVVPASVMQFKAAGGSPDHGLVGMEPGEGAVNRRGMDLIGEDGLRAINQGRAPMAPIIVQQVYGHRVFDSFVVDNLRRGGPLASAIAGQRKPGHRRIR